MFTHVFTRGVRTPTENLPYLEFVETNGEINFDGEIPGDASTNVFWQAPVGGLMSFAILASAACNIIVVDVDPQSIDNGLLVLEANAPLIWTISEGRDRVPLAPVENVFRLFCQVPGADPVRLKIRALVDLEP